MQHWLTIIGSGLGIVGTGALSIDLLTSKISEESISEFRNLQDDIESRSKELTVRMNGGLSSLAHFISGYLSISQLMEQEANGQNPEVPEDLKKSLSQKK